MGAGRWAGRQVRVGGDDRAQGATVTWRGGGRSVVHRRWWPRWARGLGSPQGVAALPLMVYITMALARWWWWQRGTKMGCCVGGAGALALRDRWSMGGGCASVGPGRHLAAHQGPAGKRQDRGQGTANRLRTGLSWVPGAAGNTWPRRLRVTALLVRLAFWAPGLGRRTIMSDGPV